MSHVTYVDHAKNRRERVVQRDSDGRITDEHIATSPDEYGELADELRKTIEGEVRFDNGSRALYATDASNYRQVPIGVVIPHSVEDAVKTIRLCRAHRAPVVNRGGGTALAGQGCNVAVLIDFSKYLNRVLSIDAVNRIGEVEPGCNLDTLRLAAERHKLTFGPDPATHDHNTLGGMLGNNSCGVHSVMAGRTSDNVESLEIVTYDGEWMTVGRTSDEELRDIIKAGGRRGEIYSAMDAFRKKYGDLIRERYPKIPRRVSGYENLDELLPENGFNVARSLVGTESTCVTILRARLNLVQSPQKRVLAILGFKDVFTAADAVPDVLKFKPIGLEGIDNELIELIQEKHYHPEEVNVLPKGHGWLVVEFGAETEEAATADAEKLVEAYKKKGHDGRVMRDKAQQAKVWDVREAALAVTAHKPDTWPGWEDSAVPREALGDYLRGLKALFDRYGYDASVYGHFGDGLIHCSINFDLLSEKGIADWRNFLNDAADLVVKYGGSFSGEHGDGQAKAALLEKMYGKELVQAFREFKAIWDPDGMMNPGKVVDPFPITSNLRMGPLWKPKQVKGEFDYPLDGSFTHAMTRCVGVGACRRHDSKKGIMCPSYMATREERYSTRGRARLLFEMLNGDPIDNLWQSGAVEEALDFCFGCKGCKSDCPVHVDMATYKAEFRFHHYKSRMRPRAAYSMGLIHRWSRLASVAPTLANSVVSAPGLERLLKWVGGVSQHRKIPPFARQNFTSWFRRRGTKSGGERVMLWPDTFNNYFRPQTAIAAVKVLESLGYEVVIPRVELCCGRPLYDWGMLDRAKSLWVRTLDALQEEIQAETPIIGLEPACVSTFRDELCGLFPKHDAAVRLSKQVLFLTEFLEQKCSDRKLPKLPDPALVQIHCHHHAVLKPDAEESVLKRLGLDYELMASGCCGMAGSFGFESAKYDISMAAAERVMLPKIRQNPGKTILANGFSCREQIEQGSGRPTTHIAELIAAHC